MKWWPVENFWQKYGAAIFIVALFCVFRLPLLGNMYHQDEYKWAQIVDPYFNQMGQIPHPPLAEVTYHYFGQVFGYLHLRIVPFIFSLAILWLLYKVVSNEFEKRAALVATFLYAIIPYAVMASIQIDIDGAILPFFVLLTVFCWRKYLGQANVKNGAAVIGALAGGFLSKISFILIGPSLLYEAFNKGVIRFKVTQIKKISLLLAAVVGGGLIIAGFLAWLYPGLELGRIVNYAKSFSFLNLGARNYAQVVFLSAKATMLLSPILLLVIWAAFKNLRKYAFWSIYALSGIIFYLVLFDFSNRTLDRYLMILTLPMVIIGADVIGEWLFDLKRSRASIMTGAGVALVTTLILMIPTRILPLVPKEAYVAAVKSFHFDFLIPFSSGSGPIGFYLSALFIGAVWLLSLIAVVFLCKRRVSDLIKVALISLITVYCFVMNVEAATGVLYGSPDKVARKLTTQLTSNPSINEVITYNDIAGYELGRSGQYFKRFYTHPIFAESTVNKMKEYSGYYLVVDFPEIDKSSNYWDYLQSCDQVSEVQSGLIKGYIFDCVKGNKNLLN